jgi:hypothetical protein
LPAELEQQEVMHSSLCSRPEARGDRSRGLERLWRYGARPAFAHERLSWTPTGHISYRLKRPWPDGRTHLELPPVAFLRRLCGIVPPPRRRLVRYHGIFGPAHRYRQDLRALLPERAAPEEDAARCARDVPRPTRERRLRWAELLRRVFAHDVLTCPCGGRRQVVAIIVDVTQARDLLHQLALPHEPLRASSARGSPARMEAPDRADAESPSWDGIDPLHTDDQYLDS